MPYLARLGVSHLYCSPVLQAAPGSTHGYDVVDPSRFNEELGGTTGFERLSRAVAAHDLGLVVDVVPNHMALAGAANHWWWDILEQGPASRYAGYFDIDWSGDRQSVLMPILGDHIGRVLEKGELGLRREGGSFVVGYHEHELPLAPASVGGLLAATADRLGDGTLAEVAGRFGRDPVPEAKRSLRDLVVADPAVGAAIDADLAAVSADPDRLDGVLLDQHYRLAFWRVASAELDYRRFFDITTLAGVRVEDDAVFAATHGLLLDKIANGDVSGLRIDHVDGLRDPRRYLDRLRAAAPSAWIVVEKILAADEHLPEMWPVAGTTGYEFVDAAVAALIDGRGLAHLVDHHARCTGDDREFATVDRAARLDVMAHELATEVERITDLLGLVCGARRRHRDHTRSDLRRVVRGLAAAFPVYRAYAVPGTPVTEVDRGHIDAAITTVADEDPTVDDELLDLVARCLTLEEPGADAAEFALRFQQLSAPVFAKGVEDTAFYRWVPLLAVNDVGGDPGRVQWGPEELHARNRHHAEERPDTMLALSTHDSKRSADVRARLVVLTEIAPAWTAAVDEWRDRNARYRQGWDDPTMELTLYQTLLGAWPVGVERVEATLLKSAREAKVHTSWRQSDPAYEDGLLAFVRGVCGDPDFQASLERFATEHDVVARGRRLALTLVTLQCCSPGVPDTYQGDETWNHSLVDPDNRRPVDFDGITTLLDAVEDGLDTALARAGDGATKLWLRHRLLNHRRVAPGCYAGPYEPIALDGPAADEVIAFARGDLVCVVPRRSVLGDGAAATSLPLPAGEWTDVLTDVPVAATDPVLTDLFARLPVAVLERRTR